MSYLDRFLVDIQRMNDTYELAPEGSNVFMAHERASQFHDILLEELAEVDEMFESQSINDIRTQMADLLADVIVYCASEARRWNIPIDKVLEVVMQSNFSKLGSDGKPIKDGRGKFLKGPGYWKPEEKISKLLEEQQ